MRGVQSSRSGGGLLRSSRCGAVGITAPRRWSGSSRRGRGHPAPAAARLHASSHRVSGSVLLIVARPRCLGATRERRLCRAPARDGILIVTPATRHHARTSFRPRVSRSATRPSQARSKVGAQSVARSLAPRTRGSLRTADGEVRGEGRRRGPDAPPRCGRRPSSVTRAPHPPASQRTRRRSSVQTSLTRSVTVK